VRSMRLKLALAVVTAGVLGVGAVAVAGGGGGRIDDRLSSFEEVPSLSTPGVGTFDARIRGQEIHYRLRFDNLESNVLQAHIHFEQATQNGDIVVFLCSNLGNGPAGTQMCPLNARSGTVTGVIRPVDVLGNASARGLGPGEFDELVRAIRAGATYVNVHSMTRPGGEIRGQLEDDPHEDDHDRGHDRDH
jgi:CHRD domain-containing protein